MVMGTEYYAKIPEFEYTSDLSTQSLRVKNNYDSKNRSLLSFSRKSVHGFTGLGRKVPLF